MTGKKFLELLAEQLVSRLAPNDSIKKFTSNSAVIGAYAEASLRGFIETVVTPLRVCTGAVIDEKLCSDSDTVPQIDTIIWSPCPSPAIFQAGDFGLVPRSSCFGVMEIKRSNYSSDVGKKIAKVVERGYELVSDIAASYPPKGKYPLDSLLSSPHPAMGVVCVSEHNHADKTLDRLVEERKTVVLFKKNNDHLIPNTKAIHLLVNFLVLARARAREMDGRDFVNLPLLKAADS